MPVGDAPRGPPLEQMTPPRHLRGFDHASMLALPRAHKEDEAAALGDAGDDAAGAAEVRGGDVEGDDMDAGADAKDVA